MPSPHSPSKAQKIAAFDPNGVGQVGSGLFGLPFTAQECDLVLLPAPWEVTVSYGAGTARAPEALREASLQVDLYDFDSPQSWQKGIYLLPTDTRWLATSDQLRALAEAHIEALATGGEGYPEYLAQINAAAAEFRHWVKAETTQWLDQGKHVGLVGGDHSTPLGFLDTLAGRYPTFSILQLDAHADLRQAYEGFTYSHASIFYNALQLPQVERLVQVGVRDICHAEMDHVRDQGYRCLLYDMRRLARARYEGKTWKAQCADIVDQLGQEVYLSFDIDALDPSLCPHTGTPVPGGLQFEEALYLIQAVVASGRRIIGFDLSEVGTSPETDYDALVGIRLLYRIAALLPPL